jgi:hypothetical protein
MAILTIAGKQFEAKTNYKFEKLAEKKYKNQHKENEMSGLESIYQDLLSYKVAGLANFWDCATAHYGNGQPSKEDIETAIEDFIDQNPEEDVKLYQDAFQAIDNSGFFRLQLKEFWNNLDLIEKMVEDEKELQQAKMARDMFIAKRVELNPSKATKEKSKK